ncbi:hypothetical protein MG293_017188 [Ovis ammon polii]|uniref:Uncharacterized protein n=1 Tax=Ovis ammon polii TaxID=230172 RepID=A0AAD4Y070_OVIAM|nr:hypothetical protein MG293_017188 [Ovis ammon polii]
MALMLSSLQVSTENWSDGAKSTEKEAVVLSSVSTQDRCVDAAAFSRMTTAGYVASLKPCQSQIKKNQEVYFDLCDLTSPTCSDFSKSVSQGFPGGPVVKNPSTNARDTGLIPGLGRPHMPESNYACVPQLLKPKCLEPVLRNSNERSNEKPLHRNRE